LLTLRVLDLVGDKIYSCDKVSWLVKGDPDKKEVTIPTFRVIRLKKEGEEAGKIASFEIYLDYSPVLQRFEIAKKHAKVET
jgi:hypothetical protein